MGGVKKNKNNNNKATPVSEIAPLDQVTMEIIARRQKKKPEATLILSASAEGPRRRQPLPPPGRRAALPPAAAGRGLLSAAAHRQPAPAPAPRRAASGAAPPASAAQLEFKGAVLAGRRCPPSGCALFNQKFPAAPKRGWAEVRASAGAQGENGAKYALRVALGVRNYYIRNSRIQRPPQGSDATSAVGRHG